MHLALRVYNFPSDSVPKPSSFIKQHDYPSDPPLAPATIRHPKQGDNFHLAWNRASFVARER